MKNKEKIIGSAVILIIIVIVLSVGYIVSKPKAADNSEIFVESVNSESNLKNNTANNEITVYIYGSVRKPDVYTLSSGSRIKDLVEKAGGFTGDADAAKINLAKKLKDEDYIYVESKSNAEAEGGNTVSTSSSGNGKIDINTASEAQLDSIPSIGPVTAKKIVDYRTQNGRFSSIEDLKKVGGIGDKTIEKIKDYIDIR